MHLGRGARVEKAGRSTRALHEERALSTRRASTAASAPRLEQRMTRIAFYPSRFYMRDVS
jgi:hypothetical protein